jgi:hypothetical protein
VPNQGAHCDSSHGTIGGAVAAAGSSDTILIGPGIRFASITTSKRLRFEGAGPKSTTIKSLNGPACGLRGGGTVTSLAARGGPGAAAIAIDPAALGKLAFNVEGVSAQGGDEANPGDSPGLGLSVTADFNEWPTVFLREGTFRAGAGDGFYHAALSFAGNATRAELEGIEAIGLDCNGIRASADAELEMTDTAARGRRWAALGDGDYQVRRSRLGRKLLTRKRRSTRFPLPAPRSGPSRDSDRTAGSQEARQASLRSCAHAEIRRAHANAPAATAHAFAPPTIREPVPHRDG